MPIPTCPIELERTMPRSAENTAFFADIGAADIAQPLMILKGKASRPPEVGPAQWAGRVDYAASSMSGASGAPSTASGFGARFWFFLSCVSITLSASISLSFCTAAISRIIRSSAAS